MIDTVAVIVKLLSCAIMQLLSFVDARADDIMIEQSIWDLPMTQSNPKFYPKSRDIPLSRRYQTGTVRENNPLLFKFIFEWDTYKVFPRGILDKMYSQFFTSGDIPDGNAAPEWKAVSNKKKAGAPSKGGDQPTTPAADAASSTTAKPSTTEGSTTAKPATTTGKAKAPAGPIESLFGGGSDSSSTEDYEYYEDATESSRKKREAFPLALLRAKRERLDDRLMEYSLPETEIFRCEKRGLEIVLWLVLDFFKAWYHFFPIFNKLYARAIEGLVKIVFEFIHWFLNPDLIGIDVAHCYKVDALLRLKPPMVGPVCKGILKFAFELVMDVADLLNEDLFIEALDVVNCFVFDHDNRITYHELDIYSNVTHIKAADSVDKVRFDGTARIDDYYRDYASKIQCFEKPLRNYDRDPETKLLKRVKYEWCLAVSFPHLFPDHNPHFCNFFPQGLHSASQSSLPNRIQGNVDVEIVQE